MRTSAIIRIVSWSVVALLLLGLLIGGLSGVFPVFAFNGGAAFHYADSGKYTVGGGSLPASGVSSVEVNWLSGGVEIVECDGTDVVFYEESGTELDEKAQMRHYNNNGRLIIQFCAPRYNIRRLEEMNKSLTVQVPRGHMLSGLTVDAVSGELEVVGVSVSHMDVESVSGSVSLSSLTADQVDIETVSGSLTLQNVSASTVDAESINGRMELAGAFGQVSCGTVSGGIVVSPGGAVAGINAESVSGRVEVRLPESIDGFTASYDSVSGNLHCDFPAQAGKGSVTYQNGRASLDFETVSGGIHIVKA